MAALHWAARSITVSEQRHASSCAMVCKERSSSVKSADAVFVFQRRADCTPAPWATVGCGCVWCVSAVVSGQIGSRSSLLFCRHVEQHVGSGGSAEVKTQWLRQRAATGHGDLG